MVVSIVAFYEMKLGSFSYYNQAQTWKEKGSGDSFTM